MAQAFQQEYMDMPIITKAYTTACVLTTTAVVWRLFSTFLFFGTFGFNFLFNIIFTYRYCRMLEEGSFRGRPADFFYMFLFGGTLMIAIAMFVNLLFLGQAFTIMLVYVWSRRNPYVRMNFFGLLNFQAPFLPWVLLAFSLLLGNSVIVDLMVYVWSRHNPYVRMNFLGLLNFQAPYLPWVLLAFSLLLENFFIVDLMGIAVGHVYYFLEDVCPNQPGGMRLLKTPWFIRYIFENPSPDTIPAPPPPQDRPGGFAWGQ